MPYWRSEDIDFRTIVRSEVRGNRTIFLILVGSSFLETTSPLYTHNLITYYQNCEEVVDWLTRHWQLEEVEHGKAMKAYVNAVWPDFDWQRAYENFYLEFEPYCAPDRYQPGKALEMLARCVTESGAATFYKALRDSTKEPVLRDLLDRMQRDEIRHYKYFLRFFRYFNEQEKNTKVGILITMLRRGMRVHGEDIFIACKYAYEGWNGCHVFTPALYRRAVSEIKRLAGKYYPYQQAIKMLIRPLESSKSSRNVSGVGSGTGTESERVRGQG